MKRILLFLTCILFKSLADTCEHGKQEEPLRVLESTRNQMYHHGGRFLQQATYNNIRIHADYSNLLASSATDQAKDYIQNQLMPSVISYLQASLKVIPLENDLKAEFTCYSLVPPIELKIDGVTADLLILVGAKSNGGSSPRTVSGTCGLAATTNRPSLGALIFNIDRLSVLTVPAQEEFLTATIHEVVHILGFSKPAYPYYIDSETGALLTNHIRNKIVNGITITIMDTPPLTQRLRTYFNCPYIEGAYLENEGGSGNQGIHFEKRIFQNELMTATSRPDQVISEMVFALLEGTGWYKPNYEMAESLTWGKGKGCSFYEGPCIDVNLNPRFSEFCGPLTQRGCSFNARGKAYCGAFPGSILTSRSLPPTWNYWGNKTSMGYQFNDNCPVYNYYANSDCENPNSGRFAFLPEEGFGPASRCFAGTLTRSDNIPQRAGYCFNSICESQPTDTDPDNVVLKLEIGSKTVICKAEGPVLLSGFNGILECPDPKNFCAVSNPVYCERNCLGRGTCVSGRCSCQDGWGGPDCGQRVYKDNCPKCLNELVNKSCFGDLCALNPSQP